MRLIALVLGILLTASVPASAADDEEMVLEMGKAVVLKLPRDADQVIIGNPLAFEVTVEDPRRLVVFGKDIGESNFIVTDKQGETMIDARVIVLPAAGGTVRVHRPGDVGTFETVYTCSAGRCTLSTGAGDAAGGAAPPALPLPVPMPPAGDPGAPPPPPPG